MRRRDKKSAQEPSAIFANFSLSLRPQRRRLTRLTTTFRLHFIIITVRSLGQESLYVLCRVVVYCLAPSSRFFIDFSTLSSAHSSSEAVMNNPRRRFATKMTLLTTFTHPFAARIPNRRRGNFRNVRCTEKQKIQFQSSDTQSFFSKEQKVPLFKPPTTQQ